VLLVIAATLAAIGLPRILVKTERVILFFDAIGLGLYTVIGATKAMITERRSEKKSLRSFRTSARKIEVISRAGSFR